jgi:transcriptional regulator with XRE-family HTH domain
MNGRDIARKLKELRLRRGLSQGEVGLAIGLSASQVSRIESGKRGLSIEQLGPWSEALGVRAELILWEPGNSGAGLATLAGRLAEEDTALLRQVAASLPHMTGPARAALGLVLTLWRSEIELEGSQRPATEHRRAEGALAELERAARAQAPEPVAAEDDLAATSTDDR